MLSTAPVDNGLHGCPFDGVRFLPAGQGAPLEASERAASGQFSRLPFCPRPSAMFGVAGSVGAGIYRGISRCE